MYNTYEKYVKLMKNYPLTADRMCQQYYDLFIELLDHKQEIIARRENQKTISFYLEMLLPIKLSQKILGKLKHWVS